MVSACWGDSCVLVPWAEYLARGDKELLKRQYPVMKRFLKGCEKRASLLSVGKHKYIWSLPYQWGDWCAPDTNMLGWWLRAPWIATAYFANSAKLVAQVAHVLGKEEDASYYEALFRKIKQAYRDVFTNKKGKVKREFQSAYVLPLAFGMVSFNHYANGAVGAWLYERCLGLEATEGGYKKFRFKPVIGGNLTWAKGSLKTSFGTIAAKWSIEENMLTMEIDVPSQTRCELIFPDGEIHSLESGHWEYKKEWKGEDEDEKDGL